MAYATRDDVFQKALAAGAFVVRARPFDAIDIATGIITFKAHGLNALDLITLEVVSGGELPYTLATGQPYSVEVVSFDSLRIIDPDGGSPITSYPNAGQGWAIAIDPIRRLESNLDSNAGIVDEHLTGHEPPLKEPYPRQVVWVNAVLAAHDTVTSLQFDNAAYRVASDILEKKWDRAQGMLQTWLKGKPVQPRPTDQDTLPNTGARAGVSQQPSNFYTGTIC